MTDYSKRKRTMVKDRVGCVRASTYDLPSTDHVYGYKQPSDPEGAGALMSTWVTANPSEHKGAEEIIVYSNVLAIKHGCITARDMRQYAKDHPCIRLKEMLTDDTARESRNYEGPFGIKTKFSEEGIQEIIQAKFTNFATDDSDYPNTSVIAKVGMMPKPRSTIANESIALTRQLQKEKEMEGKKRFVMKKFQNVKGIALKDILKTGSAKGATGESDNASTSHAPESEYH